MGNCILPVQRVFLFLGDSSVLARVGVFADLASLPKVCTSSDAWLVAEDQFAEISFAVSFGFGRQESRQQDAAQPEL
eukprot:9169524-Lingulodinium_polyedra.AAC.1